MNPEEPNASGPAAQSDDPLAVLGSLPPRDVDSWRAEQIRKLALLALEEARAEASRPLWRSAERLVRWVLEPTYLAASSAAVLFISFQSAASLLLH